MVTKFGKLRMLTALLLALALVLLAGCQSIANVDFNKALTNALKVTSSEGKQSVELKLELDEAALEDMPEDELALIKLLSNVKLQLDNVKAQDENHLSFDGSLAFGEEASIAFSAKLSDTLAVIELEGAKQPFVLDMADAGFAGMPAEEAAAEVDIDSESLAAIGHRMLDTVGAYVINNLPNPERIEAKPATEQVGGASVPMMHVHFDMNGPEIWAWVKQYVDALAADRAGLDRMIAGIYEIIEGSPELSEVLGIPALIEEGGLDAPTTEDMLKEATDEIAALLADWQAEMKKAEEAERATLDTVFSESLALKADVYVDAKLDIRKQAYELTYVPGEAAAADLAPLKGLKLTIAGEAWNVNGDVTAEAPAASDDALGLEELSEMHGYQLLKRFDETSAVYDLLKNTFHVGKQSISWYPYEYDNPVILTPANITIIPLRDTADALGGKLSPNAKNKSIVLFDEATGTTIEVKVGSDAAIVNGKSVNWSFPVTSVDGVTYVPARDLARALHANLAWTTLYGDEKVFTLEREV
ncbi:copper amine oxidase N-terminal domain-containing protein [Paenibacillus arenilitoris]|uniref:Copper amine oxidase N-terminal domain-containing protein n=1 Tax=Paenibacillus arenilitoris TaxID=2772299 RepID=A0A927CIG9_9BACL|nr:copper amine oxidase N-terminal domain-containing protein [Paenibacillus arenilitoris]MBD2868095.1 copper amine oxidase N-terminal domain-containing protein [Paenibacillus arenilitoris]